MLFSCIKRNDKREVKVAQLAGSVAEMSAYHHGEVSTSRPQIRHHRLRSNNTLANTLAYVERCAVEVSSVANIGVVCFRSL